MDDACLPEEMRPQAQGLPAETPERPMAPSHEWPDGVMAWRVHPPPTPMEFKGQGGWQQVGSGPAYLDHVLTRELLRVVAERDEALARERELLALIGRQQEWIKLHGEHSMMCRIDQDGNFIPEEKWICICGLAALLASPDAQKAAGEMGELRERAQIAEDNLAPLAKENYAVKADNASLRARVQTLEGMRQVAEEMADQEKAAAPGGDFPALHVHCEHRFRLFLSRWPAPTSASAPDDRSALQARVAELEGVLRKLWEITATHCWDSGLSKRIMEALAAPPAPSAPEARLSKLDILLAGEDPPDGLWKAVGHRQHGTEGWHSAVLAWRWFREQLAIPPAEPVCPTCGNLYGTWDILESHMRRCGGSVVVPPAEPQAADPVYHHYFSLDGGATYRTGCGAPPERGHLMPELNHVTCEACRDAFHRASQLEDIEPAAEPQDRFSAALAFAAEAHAGQIYRGHRGRADQPYILHPLRVAANVTADAAVAALLHDVLEDTSAVLPPWLYPEEAEALRLLTRQKGIEGYEDYIRRLLAADSPAGAIARTVKRADLRDNLDHDPPSELYRRYSWALELLNRPAAGEGDGRDGPLPDGMTLEESEQ